MVRGGYALDQALNEKALSQAIPEDVPDRVVLNPTQLESHEPALEDVFGVLGAEKKDRCYWAIWEEESQSPNLVIELPSNSTARLDKGAKKSLHQGVWRLPEYYWFEPEPLELAGLDLEPTEAGYFSSQQLRLLLGIHQDKLRWFSAEGELIPLPKEAGRQQPEQEGRSKEQALQQLLQLQTLLRSQGLDPDSVPQSVI